MQFRKFLILFLIFILGLAVGSNAMGASPNSTWAEGWYQGSSGYDKALEEYKTTNKPMLVYMNVVWCPYCRKFEKNILSLPKVQDFLKDKIKVVLNPENSREEKQLALRYGIMGFPSFFVHAPQPGRTSQIYTGVPPEQFIEFVQEALT